MMQHAFSEISPALILAFFGANRVELLETFGALLGASGALLLASRSARAGWGFVLFLASNGLLLAFAASAGHWRLFAMQVVFTATSLIGIWRWLLQPWMDRQMHDLFPETRR